MITTGLCAHQIGILETSPNSYYLFRESVSQPSPPPRMKNNNNQQDPRLDGNRDHQPDHRRQDGEVRDNNNHHEPLLALVKETS